MANSIKETELEIQKDPKVLLSFTEEVAEPGTVSAENANDGPENANVHIGKSQIANKNIEKEDSADESIDNLLSGGAAVAGGGAGAALVAQSNQIGYNQQQQSSQPGNNDRNRIDQQINKTQNNINQQPGGGFAEDEGPPLPYEPPNEELVQEIRRESKHFPEKPGSDSLVNLVQSEINNSRNQNMMQPGNDIPISPNATQAMGAFGLQPLNVPKHPPANESFDFGGMLHLFIYCVIFVLFFYCFGLCLCVFVVCKSNKEKAKIKAK